MQKIFAALQWSIFAASTIASPVVVPLEALTVEGVDQYLIPAKLGSTKQSVLILPWGAGPSYDRYVVDLLDDTFCPQADPNVPGEVCENYYGGLFNVEESTTYKPDDDDDTSSSDLLYGTDSLEMGGVTLSNVGVNVWGVRDDGNTSYQGGRPRLSYSNGSTIWEALSSTPNFNSRSVASFPGAIEAQGNATLTTGQYPGSLIFGGYDKKLIQGPVLSAAMQKPSSSDDIAYSSPRFQVTSLVYRHPVSGNESNMTTVWSNDEGFDMYIETRPPLSMFYDTLYLPSSAIDLLAGAVGAEKRPGSTSDIYAEDLYILSDDTLLGDLVVTLRLADPGPDIVLYPADLSQFEGRESYTRELSITVPSANLRQKQLADYSYSIDSGDGLFDSPRNYTGYVLGARAVEEGEDQHAWGRPFLQSIYQIFEYDLGLYHMAPVSFEAAREAAPDVVSLDRPFVESFHGAESTGEGAGSHLSVSRVSTGVALIVAIVFLVVV